LTTTDPSVTQVQTLYAIKDPLDDLSSNPSAQASFNAPRTITSTPATSPLTYMFLPRYLVSDTQKVGSGTGTPIRVLCKTVDCSAGGTDMDWAGLDGWYVDFPESGERVNVQMNLTLGTLVVPSNIPAVSSCESGGHGWVNYMDFKSGLSIPSTVIGATTEQPVASRPISNALIVGVNMVQLPDNTLAAIVSTSDYQNQTVLPAYAPASFSSRLDFWRDLEAY
jgi:type IV pilus assembly protein PilY1